MQWFSGKNNFKLHSIENNQFYTTIVGNNAISNMSIDEILLSHLGSTKSVDLMYSGGTDSELVLEVLGRNKIKVNPCIIKLTVDDVIVNTHDLYYAEKYCKEHNYKLYYFTLDLKPFILENQYLDYIAKYLINQPHVASHFWLIKQLEFPIMGGDWPWVHTHKENKVLSPIRLDYSFYDKFMLDNNINGIGNMLGHSIESLLYFIKLQLSYNHFNDYMVKYMMYKTISPNIEKRFRSYGWEGINQRVIPISKIRTSLILQNKNIKPIINWDQKICEILNTKVTQNDSFI